MCCQIAHQIAFSFDFRCPQHPLPNANSTMQQVGVVDAPVAVDIHAPQVAARLPEGEQHRQQVSVIDAAVVVDIAVVRRAGRRVEQERLPAVGRGVVARVRR
jgi:hypothetical protein